MTVGEAGAGGAASVRSWKQVGAVYAAGLLQGLALVTFPAASAVFTDPHAHGLSNGEYGVMFAPQTVLAVTAALLGGRFVRRWGEKRVLLLGLAADLASMALLVSSRFVLGTHSAAFAFLLGATALMGIGFGLTIPVVNALAASLFPRRVDVAVLALNALLGLGTALAPVFVALFVGFGIWWGLPLAVGGLLAALILWTLSLPLGADEVDSVRHAGDSGGASEGRAKSRGVLSRQFWLFAAFALCYGIVETLNGNWAILYMKGVLGAPAGLAAVTLTLFWAAATAGRVLFASIDRWLSGPTTFRLLPWVIALAFIATALAPSSAPGLGTAAFGLAGLGCSALLPLTISLGRQSAPPGHLIACYQIGYGVAAFGIGPLRDRAGLGLRPLFGGAAAIAVALAALSAAIVGTHQKRKAR
ncbi:MAG TPA: MFS transporter [Polyangia bacterium]|nr:MFS transporter [Polyangia bacterium]